MTEPDKGSNADWARFWDQAQRQAWDAWSQMARQAMPQPEPQPDQFWKLYSDGLERLWQGRGAQLSGTAQDVFSRMIDQGKGFHFLSHELLRAVEKIQGQAQAGIDWKLALREAIDRIQDQLRQCSGMSVGQTALWGLPAEMWERLAAAISVTPGDWAKYMGAAAGISEQPAKAERGWLDYVPAIGATREWQLHAKEGELRAEKYQKAWRGYAAKLLDVGLLALDYLYERLIEAGETGTRIRSLRSIYDLWIEAAEQAYADVVNTPEFAVQQAEVINAAVALKLYLNKSLETAARINNRPTRSELDSAHRAIKLLQEELGSLRAQLAGTKESPSTRRPTAKSKSK